MNYYENIVILDPSLSEENLSESIGKITALMTKNGGEILKSDSWGKKNLAYEINKNKKGYYHMFVFKSPSDLIKKLEDYYKVFDPVFKFLIVKLGKKETAALIKSLQTETKEVTTEEGANVV